MFYKVSFFTKIFLQVFFLNMSFSTFWFSTYYLFCLIFFYITFSRYFLSASYHSTYYQDTSSRTPPSRRTLSICFVRETGPKWRSSLVTAQGQAWQSLRGEDEHHHERGGQDWRGGMHQQVESVLGYFIRILRLLYRSNKSSYFWVKLKRIKFGL